MGFGDDFVNTVIRMVDYWYLPALLRINLHPLSHPALVSTTSRFLPAQRSTFQTLVESSSGWRAGFAGHWFSRRTSISSVKYW